MADASTTSDQPNKTGPPTVLVVDDEEDILDIYRTTLQGEFNIIVAKGGEEALDRMKSDVDIVFLDREMPDMRGREVLEEIRNRGYNCMVSMVTGVDPDVDIQDMEFDDYLVKPVTGKALARKVEELLDRMDDDESEQKQMRDIIKSGLTGDLDPEQIETLIELGEIPDTSSVFGDWDNPEMIRRVGKELQYIKQEVEDPSSPLPKVVDKMSNLRPEAPALTYGPNPTRSVYPDLPAPKSSTDEFVFEQLNYSKLHDWVQYLSIGFNALNVQSGTPVAIISGPRFETALVDLAIMGANGVTVGIPPNDDPSEIKKKVDAADVQGVIIDTEQRLNTVRDALEDSNLDFVVSIESLGDRHKDVESIGSIYQQSQRHGEPKQYEKQLDQITPDDPAAITYVDGDGGSPIPLKITHEQLRTNANQLLARLACSERPPIPQPFGPRAAGIDDVTVAHQKEGSILTTLPPDTVANRVISHYLPLLTGGETIYTDNQSLLETAAATSPDTIATSGKVAQKTFEHARDQVLDEDGRAARFYSRALSYGLSYWKQRSPSRKTRVLAWLTDAASTKKIRERFGGELRTILTIPDSVDTDVAEDMYATGISPVQCYAPTRTGTIVSVGIPEEPPKKGFGTPLPQEEIKIGSAPEDAVVVDDSVDVGELHIRGPNIPEAIWSPRAADGGRREYVFDKQGYIRTGTNVTHDDEDRLSDLD